MSDSAEERVSDSALPCEVLPSCHVPPSARRSSMFRAGNPLQTFRVLIRITSGCSSYWGWWYCEGQNGKIIVTVNPTGIWKQPIHSGQIMFLWRLPYQSFLKWDQFAGCLYSTFFVPFTEWFAYILYVTKDALCLPCSKVSCRGEESYWKKYLIWQPFWK